MVRHVLYVFRLILIRVKKHNLTVFWCKWLNVSCATRLVPCIDEQSVYAVHFCLYVCVCAYAICTRIPIIQSVVDVKVNGNNISFS